MLFFKKYGKIKAMKLSGKVKNDLDKKFQTVIKTPASFDFFVAIHDFVEHIELNSSLASGLSSRAKPNREQNIPSKYNHLKQIYQGLEDVNGQPGVDLGHTRYMVRVELDRIKNKDVSESNSFWKKRELFRKLTEEIYERLSPDYVA
ncbi:hypothetical protein KJ866_04785 [Patescibacteria group bacterium]|nr:hypothetical protein [Patescibacteria group bacterium]MBU2264596.1 hypothetical protein [Patescibacteria group bacterium]